MLADEAAKALHDRATRGLKLSSAEQSQLEAWYAQQDAEEMAVLSGGERPNSLSALRTQVEEAVAQLLEITQQIQTQAAENERLKREIGELQHQLAQRLTAQRA